MTDGKSVLELRLCLLRSDFNGLTIASNVVYCRKISGLLKARSFIYMYMYKVSYRAANPQ